MEDNAGRRAALGKGAPREPSSARQDTIEEPEDALKSRHQGLPHHEVPLWSLNVKTKLDLHKPSPHRVACSRSPGPKGGVPPSHRG